MADDAVKKSEDVKKTKTRRVDRAGSAAARYRRVPPHDRSPFVGREKSVRALEEVMNEEKQILLLTQKVAAEDDPRPMACTSSARSRPCCSF